MSQNYSFKFDQMRDNNATEKKEDSSESGSYQQLGHVRNLGFVWPDGRKKFLNYAYLVSAEFLPAEGILAIEFTSDVVTLKGVRLEKLYEELRWHIPKEIICYDMRYREISDAESFIVHEIQVEKR